MLLGDFESEKEYDQKTKSAEISSDSSNQEFQNHNKDLSNNSTKKFDSIEL
jgi:hypothetical protein